MLWNQISLQRSELFIVYWECKVYSQTEESSNHLTSRGQRHRREFWLSWFIWFPHKQNGRHLKCDCQDICHMIPWNQGCKRQVVKECGHANMKRSGLTQRVRKSGSIWLCKDSLCLVIIQFQFVLCHPGLHVRDACLHGQDSGMHLIRRTRVK